MKRETKTAEAPAAESTFEDDLRRLESIVRELEGGALPLEQAFSRFEEGVRLARSCRSRLETIEGRIAQLLENGEVRTITPTATDED